MSRYEDSDRYDFSRLLDWKKAQVQQGDASGLQPDETYTLNWVIPYGSQEQARNWIYANRQGFQGPEIPFMQLDGFWRTLQVRYQVVDPKNSNAGVNIQHIIAKGYYTSIDWDTARILSEDSSASNDSSAGIPNSESAQEQKFLQVRFPFIAPESVSSIVGSVSVPSPVTIRGNTYTGLNKILEAARLEEDGSYSVLVTLADPQYTLESYSDAGGTNQQDIVYLWDVPKDLAQTLIDNWKSTNPVSASASADYNDSQKLVNIVLRKNSLVKPNLTLAGINVACDTTQNFHFAWGYQKEDIQAFIDAHNTPTGTGTRQVQVQTRSDGLYDITIIETVVSADDPPHFDITLGVGDKITNTQKYGWNISKSQLSSIKSAYESKIAGETKSFRVTRQDDCTFDYEGSIVKQLKQEAEVVISGSGITTKSKTIRGTTDTSTGYSSSPRARHSVNIRKEDDGTNTINVNETTVLYNPKSGAITGNGITTSVKAAANANSVLTTFTADKRNRVSLSIQPNDDGTVNFTESKQTVAEVTAQESVITGSEGIEVKSKAAKNLDAPPSNLYQSGKRKRHNISLSANDDGTWDAVATEQTFKEVNGDTIDIPAESGYGVRSKAKIYKNTNNLSPGFEGGPRKRHSIFANANDDGTIDYTVTQTELPKILPKNTSYTSEDCTTTNVRVFENLDEIPSEEAEDWTPDIGRQIIPDVRINQDGTYSGSIRKIQTQKVFIDDYVAGTKLNKQSVTTYINDREFEVSDVDPEDGETITFRGTPNDDGTISWQKVVETASESEMSLEGGIEESGFKLEVKYETFKNQPVENIENESSVGKEVSYQNVQILDNNLCNYVKVTQTLTLTNTTQTVMSEKITQRRDQAISTKIGRRVTQSSLASTVTVPTVTFIGRKQKRVVTRSISRTYSIERPDANASTNERVRAGSVKFGAFTVHFLDKETIDIGDWLADGGEYAGGLYKTVIDLTTT